MGNIAKNLGQRIKELREQKNITQLKLAEILNMEASNLSKIERGVQIPKEESLEKLVKALDVEIHDLFEYDHFDSKEILINKINQILNISDEKDVRRYYKIIKEIS